MRHLPTPVRVLPAALALAVLAAPPTVAAPPEDPPPPDGSARDRRAEGGAVAAEFESYALVLLRRGPSWTPEVTPAVQELQARHLQHMAAMAEAGKLVIAGPFSDQADESLRGMCLYRVASVDEARRLAEADPAVQAGRLKVEVLTWWVEKGWLAFPKAPPPR